MKIGLIAMSGVRAHDPELAKLGVTLPGFVERNKVIASLPSLGLLTLAALTPKDVEIEYRDVDDFNKLDAIPDGYDLVAISSFSAQMGEAYALADQYQKLGIPVVLGGLHVTALPEEAKQHCTTVVAGEGELFWERVVKDFQKRQLKPYYTQRADESYDFAEAPIPRFDLLDIDKYNRLTVQTSRGCPHLCDFCASSVLLTRDYKVKPVEKVMREIRAIKALWSRPFIEFADDNSFISPKHYKGLLRQLIKEKIRWFTEADISVARDDEMLGLMRDSGCKEVLIGLESPGRASLDGIELKTNWKLKQLDGYRDAISKIQSFGIRVNGCFILGLDGDTTEQFEDIHEFAQSSGLYDVQVTIMTAFPGTPLYGRLKRENRIVRDGAWELCTLFDVNHLPKNMSVGDLERGLRYLVERIYSAEETASRRYRFRQMVRKSPNFSIASRS